MAGLLARMLAGGVAGAGAGLADVGKREHEIGLQAQLAEQKARADHDRAAALQRLAQAIHKIDVRVGV